MTASQLRWMPPHEAVRTTVVICSRVVALSCRLHRPHYRRQADREVNAIIDKKASQLGYAPGGYRYRCRPAVADVRSQ